MATRAGEQLDEELLRIIGSEGRVLRAMRKGGSVILTIPVWTANNMQDSEDFQLHQPWDALEEFI